MPVPMRAWAIAALLLIAAVTGCGTARNSSARDVAAAELVPPLTRIELALIGAAVDSITGNMDANAAICIAVLGGPGGSVPAPPELLGQLTGPRQFVGSDRCPRTYASMVQLVDSLGRPVVAPPGHVDPYRITLGRLQFERPDYAHIRVRVLQGMAGSDFGCTVQQYRERASAYCELRRRWIS